MGLFDGFFDDVATNFMGSFVNEFGESMGSGLSGFLPQPVSQPFGNNYPQAIPVSAPAVQMAGRAIAAGLPAWSARFPALWQFFATKMPAVRPDVGTMLRMLRKWGPAAMTGIMGAAAVSDLVKYSMSHKTRRMNPANTRALRRSLRRLKSFDRLSTRVSQQLSKSCRAPRRSSKKCA